MRYLLGIPFVNRPDLLQLAVESMKPCWARLLIIDNSPSGLPASFKLPKDASLLRPPVPLSFSQTMNLLRAAAGREGAEVLLTMHNDAEAAAGTPESLLSIVAALQADPARRWGAVFTQYDTLAAFSLKALSAIGDWDTCLPWYFADNDYYRRLSLADYELIESGLGVEHHGGSCTLRSDPALLFRNSVTYPLYKRYYSLKWGGNPGAETFTTPFSLSNNKDGS